MFIKELLIEKKKTEKPKKIIYSADWNVQESFPDDTIGVLEKEIKKEARDLTKNWKNPIGLVDYIFKEWKVPKPEAFLKKRWQQYLNLLQVAIKALGSARGVNGNWRTT